MSAVMIDPPSGWKYGFPCLYDKSKDGDMRDFLLSKGYPEKDVDFALSYMRVWIPESEETK